jgi:hypothetical protein
MPVIRIQQGCACARSPALPNPVESQLPTSSSMSQYPTTTTSSSNFNVIFEKALKAYKINTKQDLLAHPLASQLQGCDSPAAILTILQEQVHQFEQSRRGDERLRRWLNPTINVLYAFSAAVGQGVGLVHILHCSIIGNVTLIPIR